MKQYVKNARNCGTTSHGYRLYLVPKTERAEICHAWGDKDRTTIDESLKELKAIPKNAYQKGFEDWKKRWYKCIISEGDYFEGGKIDIDE